MSNKLEFPFVIENAFFAEVSFRREPNMPADVSVGTEAQIGVLENFPQNIQVTISIKSEDNSQLHISMVLIGQFKYIGNDPEIDKQRIEEFLSVQGVGNLWPYIITMARTVTASFGMNPLNIPTPAGLYHKEEVTA